MPCPLVPTMTSFPVTILTAEKSMHEDDIFERLDVLHFFSEECKDYIYAKSPNMR